MSDLKFERPHEWKRIGDVMMSFTRVGDIDDELWAQFIADLANNHVATILSATGDGASVSATHRRAAADVMRTKNIAAIVLTDSAITRGVLTAVSWLGAKATGYSWSKIDEAVSQATSDPTIQKQLLAYARRFQIEVVNKA